MDQKQATKTPCVHNYNLICLICLVWIKADTLVLVCLEFKLSFLKTDNRFSVDGSYQTSKTMLGPELKVIDDI